MRRLRKQPHLFSGGSVGIKPLRGFFPTSAGHHQNEANRHSAGADAVFCGIASLTKASFLRVAVSKKIAREPGRFASFRDSVGIREIAMKYKGI